MISARFKHHVTSFFPQDSFLKSKWLLAVSGGVDSVVLCDLAFNAGIDFTIAHCNFQLRGGESDRDEQFVRALAVKYQQPILVKHFDTDGYAAAQKINTQMAARQLRYQWFYEILEGKIDYEETGRTPDLLVTAHHANDNLETLLMNFFKGTGISGLHGILPLQNKIFRPLLPFKKDELLAYAKQHALDFVEDSSNLTDKYSRNYIRHQLMPVLEKLYPTVEDNLLMNIERFTEVEVLYNQSISNHKKKLLEIKGSEVHIPVLKLQQSVPLRSIVFEIITAFGFSAGQVSEVINLLSSESGRYVSSATHRVIRNRRWLIISPLETEIAANILVEETDQKVQYGGGELVFERKEVGSSLNLPIASDICCVDMQQISFPLLLRKWKQGDYFYPLGMKKKKKLSRFFIDRKLSKTDKEKIWVIEMNKKIVWVIGQRIDDRFKVQAGTKQLLKITWKQ